MGNHFIVFGFPCAHNLDGGYCNRPGW